MINVVASVSWLFFHTKNSFYVSTLLILVMIGTALPMAIYTVSDSTLNIYEWISMRLGFSIYSGWLTAATILNIAILLKRTGKIDESNVETWCNIFLIIAYVCYTAFTFLYKDLVYGAVLIWVLIGIKTNPDGEKFEKVQKTTNAVLVIYAISYGIIVSQMSNTANTETK